MATEPCWLPGYCRGFWTVGLEMEEETVGRILNYLKPATLWVPQIIKVLGVFLTAFLETNMSSYLKT